MAREILLTQGQVAIVDDEDFEWLNRWKWCAAWSKSTQGYYAVRSSTIAPKKIVKISMHRLIMSAPPGVLVDHKEPSETLNNQRSNLRLANRRHSSMNRRKFTNIAYKGVRIHLKSGLYQARITLKKETLSLGYFREEIDAARTYDRAAIANFGGFALLNFPREEYVNG